MNTPPTGHWMRTVSGRAFYPTDPRPEAIHIEDIGTRDEILHALLHDASEAYLGDVVWPLKQAPEMAGYKVLEKRVEAAIAKRFSLPEVMPPIVKHFDLVLLATEKRDLMREDDGVGRQTAAARVELEASAAAETLKNWHCDVVQPLPAIIWPWSSGSAQAEFMHEYRRCEERERARLAQQRRGCAVSATTHGTEAHAARANELGRMGRTELLATLAATEKLLADRASDFRRMNEAVLAHLALPPLARDSTSTADTVLTMLADYRNALDNLTTTQARCTELFQEARALRRERDAMVSSTVPIHELAIAIKDGLAERGRQDAKFGPVDKHLECPDGTGGDYVEFLARAAKLTCDEATAEGRLSWAHILTEEFFEALAEEDGKKLRGELVQVAAVACKWVETIDARARTESP